MLVECFSGCFWDFQFLTQSDHFAKAIAFVWGRFLPVFKIVSFFFCFSACFWDF